jgi:hypothetical protein
VNGKQYAEVDAVVCLFTSMMMAKRSALMRSQAMENHSLEW